MRAFFGAGLVVYVMGCSGGASSPPPGETPDPILPPSTDPAPNPAGAVVTRHADVSTLLEVTWDQPVDADEVWLSWTLAGSERTSPVRAVPAGPAYEVVLGLTADTDVAMALHSVVSGVEDVVDLGTHRTGPLPSDLVEPTVTVADPGPGYWVTSTDVGPNAFFGPFYTVILDRAGRVVWYRKTPENRLSWQIQVPPGGGYLTIDQAITYAFQATGPSTVVRTTLDGRVVETLDVPGMLTSYDELPDGSVLFDAERQNNDFWLSRRWPDGTVEPLWSCKDWSAGEPWASTFWGCATNTVQWNPASNSVLWSTFETDVVVEISLDTNEVVRAFGPHTDAYAYTTPDSAMNHQHFPGWTPDGLLIASTWSVDGQRQHARAYAIDDTAREAREVWSVETPDWILYGGQIQEVGDDRYLWQLGTAGVIQEIDGSGAVVWALDFHGDLTGNVTPVSDLYFLNTGFVAR